MPTYVYICDACGSQFEQVQSFKDAPLQVCRCGREGQVRRVLQPVGIVFRGSGWYITDSRKSDSGSVTDTTPSEKAAPTAAPAADAASGTPAAAPAAPAAPAGSSGDSGSAAPASAS